VATKTKPAKAGYQNWRAHLLMRRNFFGSAGAQPSEKIRIQNLRRLKSALIFFVINYGLKPVA